MRCLCLLFICLFFLNFAHVSKPLKQVKIGILLPITGDIASFGQDAKNAVILFLEMHENDFKSTAHVIPLYQDSEGTPQGSVQATNKLITDQVDVIVGDLSTTNTIAASVVSENFKIPMISPSATGKDITVGKKYFYRTCYDVTEQGKVLAEFALNKWHARKFVIITDSDSDYSRDLSQTFKDNVKDFQPSKGDKKPHIVGEYSYSKKDKNFSALVSKIKRSSDAPDVVFIPGFPSQVASILKDIADYKLKIKVLGADGWEGPELFDIAGKAANGHVIASHFSPQDPNPVVQDFVKKYNARFKRKPGVFAALTFDSMGIVFEAIKQTHEKKITLNEALKHIQDFQGVTGHITFDKNGNAQKPVLLLETSDQGNHLLKD